MDNILKGIIKVEAPGVDQVFKVVGASAASTEKSLSSLQRQVIAFGGGVRTFTNNFSGLSQSFIKTPAAVNNTSNSLQNLSRTTSAAMTSTINLGRVIQDLPFGFMAIANNLNPLLESFQRLKAETGSTGSALKALAGSIFGAGGIGLAVSLLTFGLTKLAMGHRSAKEESEAHKKEVDAAAEKQREFQQALNAASAAVLRESSSLKDLRTNLVNTSGDVQELTKDTINLALAQFLFDKKNEAVQKLITAELEKQLKIRQIQRPFADVQDFGATLPKTADSLKVLNPYAGMFDQLNQNVSDAKEGLRQINAQSFGLEKLMNDLFLKTFKSPTIKPDKKVIIEDDFFDQKLERPIRILADIEVDTNFKEDQDLFDDIESRFNNKELGIKLTNIKFEVDKDGIAKSIESFDIESNLTKPVTVPLKLNITPLSTKDQAYIDSIKSAQKLGEDTAKAVNDGLRAITADSIGSIAQGLGEALAGGDIKNVFQGFAAAVGSGLQTVGKQLIAIGLASEKVQLALKSLFTNPFLAIAAGAGLIALGAALKASLSKGVPGRASGGPVRKGQPYIVGEVGKEVFIPDQSGTIIPNHKLGNLGKSLSSFGNFGSLFQPEPQPAYVHTRGGIKVQVFGQSTIKGRDIVTVFTQSNNSINNIS